MFFRSPSRKSAVHSAAESSGASVPSRQDTIASEATPVSIDSFANVVASMSRFLASLAATPAFKSSNLGLGEWLTLTLLMRSNASKGIGPKYLSRALGITAQRAQQITTTLEEAGAIVVTREGRKRTISATSVGKERLQALNVQLEAVLAKSTSRSVLRLGKTLRLLGRSIEPVNETRKANLKKAKKVTQAAETPPEKK